MALRTRQNVWTLSLGTLAAARSQPWHPVLDTYARGVELMQAKDPQIAPDSWLWAANTHWTPRGQPVRTEWNQCPHGTLFFLPWHRAYLAWFEGTIRTLTGEDAWALPYWNYSEPNSRRARTLPPEFRVPERMVDGVPVPNPLFVAARRDTPLLSEDVDIVEALAERLFLRPEPRAGFGAVDPDGIFGLVEMSPHNFVHGFLGGLMGSTTTAGRDPIFWLHHANIDRLWDAWKVLDGSIELTAQSGVPATVLSAWRSARFGFGLDRRIRYTMADCERPDLAPMEYGYDSIELSSAVATAVAARRLAAGRGGPIGLDEEPPPETWDAVGASNAARSGEEVEVPMDAPLGLDEEFPLGLVIELAGCRAVSPSEVYTVEVAVPGGVWRRVGRFSTFGLLGTPDEEERTYLIDASVVAPVLVADGWTGRDLRVRALADPLDGPPGDADGELLISQIAVFLQRA